jgi:hypothetical protein
MVSNERLESLKTKHATIEAQISEIEKSAFIDTQEVRKLKLEKLKLKEEMELHDVPKDQMQQA